MHSSRIRTDYRLIVVDEGLPPPCRPPMQTPHAEPLQADAPPPDPSCRPLPPPCRHPSKGRPQRQAPSLQGIRTVDIPKADPLPPKAESLKDRMTDACENITSPHTWYTVGNDKCAAAHAILSSKWRRSTLQLKGFHLLTRPPTVWRENQFNSSENDTSILFSEVVYFRENLGTFLSMP